MVAGFDRYFQIAPCFRDEDARADRSPGEFYQLDLEMSFATQDDVFATMEPIMHGLFEEFAEGKAVTPYPFPRIPYREAIAKYGTDKPDLRNPLVMQDVSEHFRGGGFGLFARILEEPKNAVWALPAPGGGSRAFADRMNAWAQGEGQPGLGYVFWRAPEAGGRGRRRPRSPATSARRRPRRSARSWAWRSATRPSSSPAIPKVFYKFAGLARTKVGDELDLVAKDRFDFCWIVDFPMFEFNEEVQPRRLLAQPVLDAAGRAGGAEQTKDPLDVLAYQYDIVVNGVELCSGAVRNHKPEIMVKAFEIAGYSAGRGRAAVRRHAERLPLRRAAARRHGAGHRPHRHAAGGRGEHPRGDRLPAEPAGAGPDDERAVAGRATSSCASCTSALRCRRSG